MWWAGIPQPSSYSTCENRRQWETKLLSPFVESTEGYCSPFTWSAFCWHNLLAAQPISMFACYM